MEIFLENLFTFQYYAYLACNTRSNAVLEIKNTGTVFANQLLIQSAIKMHGTLFSNKITNFQTGGVRHQIWLQENSV